MKIGVIGAGSWGTALAKLVAEAGHEVTLWAYESEVVSQIRERQRNEMYFPGVPLPSLKATADLAEIATQQDLVISAVPSHVVRDIWSKINSNIQGSPLIISATKGVETGSLLTMTQVLREVLPPRLHSNLGVLSGPSFAKEVAARHPTAVVVASSFPKVAESVQKALSTDRFRIYTSDDVPGVEIGGAVKNVVAIATGIADGLQLGHNARAALITRGLAEITRLAVANFANPLTLAGLAGMGDLVLTCTSELSRNHTVGLKLGQGQKLSDILAGMNMVAEGIKSAQSCYELACKLNVDMPITKGVYEVLYEGLAPIDGLEMLMGRELKPERDKY
jgi:glycerol-3-phosphate dehydrogenase (NAD(P)+)